MVFVLCVYGEGGGGVMVLKGVYEHYNYFLKSHLYFSFLFFSFLGEGVYIALMLFFKITAGIYLK